MDFGIAAEAFWNPFRDRLLRFLASNLEHLSAGPSMSIIDGVARLDTPEGFTRDFVERTLTEGLSYSDSNGQLVRLEERGCWMIVDDDEPKALVVDNPAKDLGPWLLADAIELASDQDIDWICLTNGAEWAVYRHGRQGSAPRVTEFLRTYLLDEAPVERLAERLLLLSYLGVAGGALDNVWKMREVLRPDRIVAAIKSEPVEGVLMRELSTYEDPDQESFYEVLLSDVGLDAIRSVLVPGPAGLQLPLFTLRAVVEHTIEHT